MNKNQNNPRNEMKDVVEQLVTSLSKQGVRVTDAAILNIDNSNPNPASNQAVDASVDAIMRRISKSGFPGFNPKTTQPAPEAQGPVQEKQPCFCSDCFTFETFEKVLGPGTYDYQPLTIGGKNFDVKFYSGANGEHIMMNPKEFSIDPSWTAESIQNELNIAVAAKDFDKAQTLLNALNNLKK